SFQTISLLLFSFFFFSSRRRHTRSKRDWSSDVCSSDLITYSESLTKSPRSDIGNASSFSYVSPSKLIRCPHAIIPSIKLILNVRSEERRVGKECRSRWSADHEIKKENISEKAKLADHIN